MRRLRWERYAAWFLLLVIGHVQRHLRVKLAEGRTVANTITTWGTVTAGAFF